MHPKTALNMLNDKHTDVKSLDNTLYFFATLFFALAIVAML